MGFDHIAIGHNKDDRQKRMKRFYVYQVLLVSESARTPSQSSISSNIFESLVKQMAKLAFCWKNFSHVSKTISNILVCLYLTICLREDLIQYGDKN